MAVDSAESQSLFLEEVDHITIVVSDLERAAAFYRDVIGLPEVERPAFGFPGKWFDLGGFQMHMNVAGAEAGKAGLPCTAELPARGFHFAFRSRDFDAAKARLDELGVEIVVGPRERPDGARQMYVYDPDGHLIRALFGGARLERESGEKSPHRRGASGSG